MKKLIVIALAAVMLLGLSSFAMAATASLDFGVNGKIGYANTGSSDVDLKNTYLVTVTAPIDNWYVGLDYISTGIKDVSDKWDGYTLKGGYSVVLDDNTRITPTLGLLNRSAGVKGSKDKLDNVITLGIDTDFAVAKNMTISFLADYGISNKSYKVDGDNTKYDLSNLLNYKLRYNYFFTDTIGASLGYYYDSFKIKNDNGTTSVKGLSLGVDFSF